MRGHGAMLRRLTTSFLLCILLHPAFHLPAGRFSWCRCHAWSEQVCMSPRKLATRAVVQQHKWALANGEWIANSFCDT